MNLVINNHLPAKKNYQNKENNLSFKAGQVKIVYKRNFKNLAKEFDGFNNCVARTVKRLNKELAQNPEHPLNKFLEQIEKPDKIIELKFAMGHSLGGVGEEILVKARRLKGLLFRRNEQEGLGDLVNYQSHAYSYYKSDSGLYDGRKYNFRRKELPEKINHLIMDITK